MTLASSLVASPGHQTRPAQFAAGLQHCITDQRRESTKSSPSRLPRASPRLPACAHRINVWQQGLLHAQMQMRTWSIWTSGGISTTLVFTASVSSSAVFGLVSGGPECCITQATVSALGCSCCHTAHEEHAPRLQGRRGPRLASRRPAPCARSQGPSPPPQRPCCARSSSVGHLQASGLFHALCRLQCMQNSSLTSLPRHLLPLIEVLVGFEWVLAILRVLVLHAHGLRIASCL